MRPMLDKWEGKQEFLISIVFAEIRLSALWPIIGTYILVMILIRTVLKFWMWKKILTNDW